MFTQKVYFTTYQKFKKQKIYARFLFEIKIQVTFCLTKTFINYNVNNLELIDILIKCAKNLKRIEQLLKVRVTKRKIYFERDILLNIFKLR